MFNMPPTLAGWGDTDEAKACGGLGGFFQRRENPQVFCF
jgi:hypothetical protein